MGTCDVSVDEIVRIGRWALRGLGMEFGVSERAAHLLAWAEAVEGGALSSLMAYDARNAAGDVRPYTPRRIADDWWSIGVAGRSLLEVGPVGIDLLTYAARTFGAGRLDIVDVEDPLFVTGLCRLGLQRGLGALVLSGGARLQIGGQPVTSMAARLDDHDTMLFGPADGPADAIAAGHRDWKVEAAQGPRALSIFLHRLPPKHERRVKTATERDLEEALRNAYGHGIIVAEEDFDRFCDFEVRTWAPTSDRSRSQALV